MNNTPRPKFYINLIYLFDAENFSRKSPTLQSEQVQRQSKDVGFRSELTHKLEILNT